jgi:signal transduction histidine kinase
MKRPFKSVTVINGREVPRLPHWLVAILGVPLEMKLFGANLIVVTVAAVLLLTPARLHATALEDSFIAIAALILGAIVNFVLVRLALGPVGALERIASGVSGGRFAARVPGSIVADHELARLSETINNMLDSLSADRGRVEQLEAEVVYARETERARIESKLDESIGQTLATATFELDTLAFELENSKVSPRLAHLRQLLRSASDQIRNISQTVHPRNVSDIASATPDDRAETRGSAGSSFDRRGLATNHDMHYIEFGSRGSMLP